MKKISLIISSLCLVILIIAGCGGQTEKKADLSSRQINIITTTGMIADAARNVGGERVKVTALMGPGVDPHLYKASAGDVQRMADADVIFYNGLHLEGAMNEVFEQMSGRVVTIAVTDGVDHDRLIMPEGSEGSHDPHVWFDVSLWMNAVEYIGEKMTEIDPDHKETYQKNTANYLAELEELHNYAKERAMTVPEGQRVLITAHDAFNYFGQAYGFEVRGLQGISTASEAGTADVQQLASFIADNKIPAIFVESSVPKRNIEAVQAAVKAKGFDVGIGGELFSDAMGTKGTPEGEYPGMVRHNVDTIIDALKGEQEM